MDVEGEYDAGLDELRAAARRDRRGRDAAAGINTWSARYITYEGSEQGQRWEHPRDGAESYPAGWVVTHGGSDWQSEESANLDEPGVAGWTHVEATDRLVAADAVPADEVEDPSLAPLDDRD
ncbi:hypothetical protein [Georgenia faecalis]|uniref:Uncharacterized protein n=1 Tax=Georgenia faecalis TaxID=2483799 RepID=A0ABV9D6A7_9MICO|nr:hypothetical protein [Georgenia faecalis]